jgi:hypothetical protein
MVTGAKAFDTEDGPDPLMIRTSVVELTPAHVEVLLNWTEELKRLGEADPARRRL